MIGLVYKIPNKPKTGQHTQSSLRSTKESQHEIQLLSTWMFLPLSSPFARG